MIEALKFKHGRARAEPQRCVLALDLSGTLERLREQDALAVYLVRQPDLDGPRQLKGQVIDRRRKNPSKQLAHYLLGQEKIPLIEANFTAVHGLKHSLLTFLENARHAGESNIYLVGIRNEIFNELWGEAEFQSGAERSTPPLDRGSVLQLDQVAIRQRLKFLLSVNDPAGLASLKRLYVGEAFDVDLLRNMILVAARSTAPVLILGETGTGKELVAQGVHHGSKRTGELKAINCGGFPAELFESELFGYVKGAFTGAVRDKEGLWPAAQNGTLFLDEIGDLSLAHQTKILRALQEARVRRVGDTDDIPVNARIISATNRDLFAMVEAGQFREDLYYRLRQLIIHTPALRDHREDIPSLAQFLWRSIASKDSPPLPKDVLEELESFPWPGNVRELKSVLASLHAMFGATRLNAERLLLAFRYLGHPAGSSARIPAEQEMTLHQVCCLRHLRRAVETIRACKVTLRPVLRPLDKMTRARIRAVSESLRSHLVELEQLCLRPELFCQHDTFASVARFKGKLFALSELLPQTPDLAREHWKSEVATCYEPALTATMEELQRVMKHK